MTLHVNDAARRVAEALNAHGQVKWVEDPELVAENDVQDYRVRDGEWRVLVHGDARDIEVTLKVVKRAPRL